MLGPLWAGCPDSSSGINAVCASGVRGWDRHHRAGELAGLVGKVRSFLGRERWNCCEIPTEVCGATTWAVALSSLRAFSLPANLCKSDTSRYGSKDHPAFY